MYVPSFVRLFNVLNAHCPGFVFRVGNANALIFRYNMILYSQDCLGVDPQPRYLL